MNSFSGETVCTQLKLENKKQSENNLVNEDYPIE